MHFELQKKTSGTLGRCQGPLLYALKNMQKIWVNYWVNYEYDNKSLQEALSSNALFIYIMELVEMGW